MLDDSSRKIIAIGEFEAETTENVLIVLKQAQKECRIWYSIKAVLTDHGSQFWANKRDKRGFAEHKFEQYLKRHRIRHVLCRVGILRRMVSWKSFMISIIIIGLSLRV